MRGLDPDAAAAAAQTWYNIAARESGSVRSLTGARFVPTGTHAVEGQPPDEQGYACVDADSIDLPYLPDPWGVGAKLRLDLGPGEPEQVLEVAYPDGGEWYLARTLRLDLVEGAAGLALDAAAGIITVSLPQGRTARLRLSSLLAGDPDLMGIVGWCRDVLPADEAEAVVEAVETSTRWMVTPWRERATTRCTAVIPGVRRVGPFGLQQGHVEVGDHLRHQDGDLVPLMTLTIRATRRTARPYHRRRPTRASAAISVLTGRGERIGRTVDSPAGGSPGGSRIPGDVGRLARAAAGMRRRPHYPDRVAYVSSGERRAKAREVALRRMRAGVRYEDLSLRDIAKELGVALSTLTYAYQSIAELMDDFDLVFHAQLMASVGSGGLREELRRYAAGTFRMVAADPALIEISRYRFAQIGDGHYLARMAGMLELFTVIRRRGRENYRLPDDLMAELFYAQISGAFAGWFDASPGGGREGGQAWYRWMIAAIDILTIAADPRPLGQPHAEPPFPLPDYALLEPPAVEEG